MGKFNSKLNIFICGNIIDNIDNDSIINELFNGILDNNEKDEKVYNSNYKFDVRIKKEIIKEINFSIEWKAFILKQKINKDVSTKLIEHILNLTNQNDEKDSSKFHNVILYFTLGNKEDENLINQYKSLKGKIEENNKEKKIETNKTVEQNIPILILFGIENDSYEKLLHINKIPKKSLEEDLNNIKSKLISIDSYFNEKGTLFKNYVYNNLFKNLYSNLSINIMLVGAAGAGKSTFINTSFGELVAKASPSLNSVTTNCTEYELQIPSENNNKIKGIIKLIDTPGFENDDMIEKVKQKINEIIKNHCDSKDFVHCILYFIKEGDRLSEGMKGFINYVFSLDIQIFFIVTHCVSEDSETKRQLIHYYKSNKITEDKIIPISLKKVKLKKNIELPIDGIDNVYKTILNFLEPQKFNSDLLDKIRQPDLFEEKLKILQEQSLLFQKLNSTEDLKKGSNLKAKVSISIASTLSGACGFIPFPFADIPPVIGIEVAMVFSIAACYGFKPSDFNIFKVFESNGEDIGVSDNRHINFISISRLIKEVSKEIISEVTESGLKKTSELIKYIPVVGTIIGGFASSLINAGSTANFGINCSKSFEKNLLGNDHGFTYLKNRIDIYKDIFSQISFLSQKENWDFEIE